MRIVNLLDTLERINFGIWNAVISNFPYFIKCGHQPEIWVKPEKDIPSELQQYKVLHASFQKVNQLFEGEYFSKDTVVLSHGCWKIPTKCGELAAKKGFVWLALPHGMLEPWSMQQKRIKKSLYYQLFEKQRLNRASELIAVSKEEQVNLEKRFRRKVRHIPNGIAPVTDKIDKPAGRINFIFMARLHHKKGVLPLLKAWASSNLSGKSKFRLTIAGPDDGELPQLKRYMTDQREQLSNVQIVGPLYGDGKKQALLAAHVYILPSFSEGFPSSILEAASHGCFPIFTKGCNFNEAFDADVAMQITPEVDQIVNAFNKLGDTPVNELIAMGRSAKKFVDENYNLETIGQAYIDLFEEKLKEIRDR